MFRLLLAVRKLWLISSREFSIRLVAGIRRFHQADIRSVIRGPVVWTRNYWAGRQIEEIEENEIWVHLER
jgi:hypothetical protein